MLWEQGDIDEEIISGLISTCGMTRKYLPEFTTQKSQRIEIYFFLGGGGGRFGLKTGIGFPYRVWFSKELREYMNVFIISVSNDQERKTNMQIRNGF